MLPELATDGHLCVLQPNGKVVETYATIVLSTGQVIATSYSVTDPTSLCDGWQSGQTASMLPAYAGLTDDQEISGGSINHAMGLLVPNTLLSCARIAYPAYAFDRNTSSYAGALPMGSRLAIPASINVDSYGWATPEGRTIATAAQKYGFIVNDQGGGGVTIRIRANSPSPDSALHTWAGPLQSDLNAIWSAVKAVFYSDAMIQFHAA
jgi:hypothetical protein